MPQTQRRKLLELRNFQENYNVLHKMDQKIRFNEFSFQTGLVLFK